MFSSDTGSVGYGLLQDIFMVTQAGAVCCHASVAILVRATVQLYSDHVTNCKLHNHLIAFLPPRLVMCTVLVLLLEMTHLQEHQIFRVQSSTKCVKLRN